MRSLRIEGSDALRISEDDGLSHVSVFSRDFVALQDLLEGMVEVTSCLDLVKGPFTAVGKFRTASEASYVMSIHHLAVDVVSWQIILDDLSRLLREENILPEYGIFQERADRVQQRQQLKDSSTVPTAAEEPKLSHVNSGLVSNFAQCKDRNTVLSARTVDLSVESCDMARVTGCSKISGSGSASKPMYGSVPLVGVDRFSSKFTGCFEDLSNFLISQSLKRKSDIVIRCTSPDGALVERDTRAQESYRRRGEAPESFLPLRNPGAAVVLSLLRSRKHLAEQ